MPVKKGGREGLREGREKGERKIWSDEKNERLETKLFIKKNEVDI